MSATPVKSIKGILPAAFARSAAAMSMPASPARVVAH